MRVALSRRARADLIGISNFLASLNPQAARRVVQAIRRTMELIRDNPRSGHTVPGTDLREIIEPRFGYRIPYWLDEDHITILRIYHSSREPLRYDELKR